MENIKEHLDLKMNRIKRFRPIDDTFFEKLAEDSGVCEEILRVILKDKELKVIEVIPQKSIKNLQGRSVRLDALCVRGNGKLCNIEVQRASNDDHLRRVRYNASCVTANIVDPGEKFEKVPDINMVYISEFDIFKKNRVIYHIEPTIIETNDTVDNGLHEVYVNTAVIDDSEISELMQCFLQQEVDNDKFPRLSERVHFFKHSEEGVKVMCRISDEIREEGRTEGRAEGRADGIRDSIGKIIEKLSVEEIINLGFDREIVLEVANAMQ